MDNDCDDIFLLLFCIFFVLGGFFPKPVLFFICIAVLAVVLGAVINTIITKIKKRR